jgi:hypothetical protein
MSPIERGPVAQTDPNGFGDVRPGLPPQMGGRGEFLRQLMMSRGGGRPMMGPQGPRGQRGGGGMGVSLPLPPGMTQGEEQDESVGFDGLPSPWNMQPGPRFDGVPGNPGGGLGGNTGYGGQGQPGWNPQSFGEWFGHKDPSLFNPAWTAGGVMPPPAAGGGGMPAPVPGAPSPSAPTGPTLASRMPISSGGGGAMPGVMPWDAPGQYSPRGGGLKPPTQSIGRPGGEPLPPINPNPNPTGGTGGGTGRGYTGGENTLSSMMMNRARRMMGGR